MKNNPHPDRSLEAANVRDELSDSPDALRSLDAIAREESSDTSIPPIPDELREQWKDRYGAARQPVAEEKKSWLGRISSLWMYGGATALAAIAILIALKDDPASVTNDPVNPNILMRGGDNFAPVADTITVYLASEKIPFQALFVTRQADFTLEAKDLESAVQLLQEKNIKSAVILDGKSGTLTPWNGQLLKDVDLIEVSETTDEYDLSEALDKYLEQ